MHEKYVWSAHWPNLDRYGIFKHRANHTFTPFANYSVNAKIWNRQNFILLPRCNEISSFVWLSKHAVTPIKHILHASDNRYANRSLLTLITVYVVYFPCRRDGSSILASTISFYLAFERNNLSDFCVSLVLINEITITAVLFLECLLRLPSFLPSFSPYFLPSSLPRTLARSLLSFLSSFIVFW